MLLHPLYGGQFEWAGQIYQGKHELFIPESWVQLAQGKMRGTPNQRGNLGVFSDLMKCAVPDCGCQIIYDPKTKVKKSTGESRQYHYYHCTDSKGVHKRLGIQQVNVSEDKIWQQLESSIQQFALPESLAVEISMHMERISREEVERHRAEYEQGKARIAALAEKQDKLYEDYSSGLIDEEDFKRLREKSRTEAFALKSKMENDYSKVLEKVRVGLNFTLELAKGAELKWKVATPTEKLSLLKRSHSNFLLDGLNVRYDLRKPFSVLAQIKLNDSFENWCARTDLNRHALAYAPQTYVSTNSTTSALLLKVFELRLI